MNKNQNIAKITRFTIEHKGELIACAAFITIAHLPLFAATFQGNQLDATKAAQFGDFVGGYLGTVALVISFIFVSGSYRNQKQTNQKTTFESRFFELLNFHRENVNDIEIDAIQGRRAFVSFIREWRLVLQLARAANTEQNTAASDLELSKLSYIAFYFGIGPNSTRVLLDEAKELHPRPLVEALIEKMSQDWKAYKLVREIGDDAALTEFPTSLGQKKGKQLKPLSYLPFEGHQSRLAHYYRHLFHLVKYAAESAPDGTAQDYIDLVRAQLSTHEQALLALNSLSLFGPWANRTEKRDYIQSFNLIKNIPRTFFTGDEIDPKQHFSEVLFAYEAGDDYQP